MAEPQVYSLNVHASYACRHSGACCTARWSIPVEPRLRNLVGTEWLVPDDRGACPQFDSHARLCRIHRDHGEAMLPDSCFHFPRRALVDGRGTFVTLSHFCPTAAALVVDSTEPMQIETAPPAFPPTRRYDGLDARGEWPPLVRADVLFDPESYSLWEQYLIAALDRSSDPLESTLSRIAMAAERLRAWNVECGPLAEWTAGAVSIAPDPDSAGNAVTNRDCVAARRYSRFTGPDAFTHVVGCVPVGLDAPAVPEPVELVSAEFDAAWTSQARTLLRFLAVKAFASWTAYQSRGVRTQVAELYATAAVLRIECVRATAGGRRPLDRDALIAAVRATDWLLVHLADREPLMEWLGKAEEDGPTDAAR